MTENTPNPTVAVIITAFNMEQYLEQAVRSAAGQTYENLRIYIVEDRSADGTLAIATRLAGEMSDRVELLVHDVNRGAGAARRTGIDQALNDGADFIITLDADDWIDPDFIHALVDRQRETGAPIVSGGITVEKGGGEWEKTCYGTHLLTGLERITRFWGERIVFMNNKIIHRSVAEKIPYCTRRFVEDTPTIIPMLYVAESVAYCETTGYHYRMQADSLTHTSSPLRWAIYRALCADDLMRFFESQPDGRELLATIPIGVSFNQQLAVLRRLAPTADDVQPYAADFADLACRILRRLN